MSPEQLVAFFKTAARVARVLGCTEPTVSEWRSRGVVPEGRQYQAELATHGALRADLPADREFVEGMRASMLERRRGARGRRPEAKA